MKTLVFSSRIENAASEKISIHCDLVQSTCMHDFKMLLVVDVVHKKFLENILVHILWFNSNDNLCISLFYHFWPFCRQLYVYLSQNWGSDGHFEVLISLNLNWFKSYGLRLRPKASSANFWKIETDKWPFYDHIWPFFCQLYVYLSQNWGSDGHFEVLNQS